MRLPRLVSVSLILFSLLVSVVSLVWAAAGDLDSSFGSGGIITTDFRGHEEAEAMVVQPDGKVVVGGWSWRQESFPDFALARYNSDGTLDPSFGDRGTVTTDLTGFNSDWLYALALQRDGKLVAGGSVSHDLALARYHSNGTLDHSFSDDGYARTEVLTTSGMITALALLPSRQIVVAGYTTDELGESVILGQYLPDGSLDSTFGDEGLVVGEIVEDKHDIVTSLAVQPDGKLLVAGHTWGGESYNYPADFALWRYNPNGSPDLTFGRDGLVTTDFAGGNDRAWSLVLHPDGRISLGGQTVIEGKSIFALVRYKPDGSLDPTFGVSGKVTTDFGDGDYSARALGLGPDGKLILAGMAVFEQDDFALARYNPDGSLDSTFGQSGKVTTAVSQKRDLVNAIAFHEDTILAAGFAGAERIGRSGNGDFAVARYVNDGTARPRLYLPLLYREDAPRR